MTVHQHLVVLQRRCCSVLGTHTKPVLPPRQVPQNEKRNKNAYLGQEDLVHLALMPGRALEGEPPVQELVPVHPRLPPLLYGGQPGACTL